MAGCPGILNPPILIWLIWWFEAGNDWLFTKFISKSKLHVSNILSKSTVLRVCCISILYNFKKFESCLSKDSSLILGLNLLISIRNCSLNKPKEKHEYKEKSYDKNKNVLNIYFTN